MIEEGRRKDASFISFEPSSGSPVLPRSKGTPFGFVRKSMNENINKGDRQEENRFFQEVLRLQVQEDIISRDLLKLRHTRLGKRKGLC